MDHSMKQIIWHQCGAAIDMLENAIKACPDHLWDTKDQFWYIAYHTLFYLDYTSDGSPATFAPPSPYTLSEFDPTGIIPDTVYTKENLLIYLQHGRQKCHDRMTSLTPEEAEARFDDYKNYSVIERMVYNMRHVQHHAAQLNLLLRQGGAEPPGWVSRSGMPL
ncbi:DinB family protein [uncultured Chitinophaga sp.]|uniref:DinB family protein n=1 Tax=uncultured Chitinophaga sp. TaxID=339340 RepID=UPI0025CE788A|nr:DinB family protein [uncultured Chitinophaga sp.]